MKGQMFVLTIIFLVGLIYAVQENLSGYSELAFSDPFEGNDYYIFRDVKDAFETTTITTNSCNEAEQNLNELVNYVGRKIFFGGFTLDVKYNLNCLYWDNIEPNQGPLNLTIRVIGKQSETAASFSVYHQVPPTIHYAEYWNIDRPENPCSLVPGDRLKAQTRVSDRNKDPIAGVDAHITISSPGSDDFEDDLELYDDGSPDHGDSAPGDGIYANIWDSTGACPSGSCTGDTTVEACDVSHCSTEVAYCTG